MSGITELPLRDIHTPDPISWWPPAPGWWMLAVLLLLGVAAIWAYIRYRHRRRALYALQDRIQVLASELDQADINQQLSILLRRACISFFPRAEVASLTGDDWLNFLNQHTRNAFNEQHAALLTESIYQQSSNIDRESLRDLADVISKQLPVLFRQGTRS